MSSKQKKLELQKVSREEKKGFTIPCSICESTEGPHLHALTSLPAKDFELLCQVNGQQIARSGKACCRHFEKHTFQRTSKNNVLVVKQEYATTFHLRPSPRVNRTHRFVGPSPCPREPPKPVETYEELQERILSLTEEVKEWKERYQKEIVEVKREWKGMQDELKEMKENSVKLGKEWEEEIEKDKKKKSNWEFMSLIGPPYNKSRFWLGISDPVPLLTEWKPFLSSKWNSSFLLSTFLVWLRRGMTFNLLSHFVGKSDRSLRKHFYQTLEDLQPWAKKQISWPTLEQWRLAHNEKLRAVYSKTLFFWVDGTVIKMFCPKDSKTARVFFNKKHGGHSYVFFVAVSPDGRICYVSECMAGTEHDKTHWNESSAPDELKGRYEEDSGFEYSTSGDKAYLGMRRPKTWLNHVTMTGLVGDDEDEQQLPLEVVEEIAASNPTPEGEEEDAEWWKLNYQCDARIARFRAVVERTIGHMKKWLVLMNEVLITRISYKKMQQLIVLIAALTNYQLKHNKTGTW
jgi:hypothetical protein